MSMRESNESPGTVETIRDAVSQAFRKYIREGTDYKPVFRQDAARSREVLHDAEQYMLRQG